MKKSSPYLIKLITFAIIFALLPSLALSQTIKTNEIQRQIESLEKRVLELECIVNQLGQEKLVQKQGPPQSAGEKWKDRQNWRKLRKGMTEKEIIEILGEPPKVVTSSVINMWFYSSGSVTFDADTRRVTGWTEP